MKHLSTLLMLAFVLSLSAVGCANKGDTKDDAEVAEQPERTMDEPASGGMERGFDEEEPAAEADAPVEEATDEEAPE